MCGIYLITNTITHKVYVGQSTDIKRRWSEHKARAFNNNNNCYNNPLYRSMRKYGAEAFTFSVLCECLEEELNEKEKFFIIQFNSVVPNGYNVLNENNTPYYRNTHYCKQCHTKIYAGSKNELCKECYSKTTRQVERPEAEALYNLLIKHKGNFTKVAKIFGLTDNAIRKWCKSYNIPYHSKDYKKM